VPRTAAHRRERGRARRLLGVAGLALLTLVWLSTTPTLSAWTSGVVANSANSTLTSTLAFSHTTSAGTCAGDARTTSTTITCPGTPVGSDSIANTGTAPASALTQTVAATACSPVQLANTRNAANPMLPRYAMAFQSAGPFGAGTAITLGNQAYAAAVGTDATAPAVGQTFGVGIFFKADSTQSGPLFSLDGSASNVQTIGSDDRTMYLGADGKLKFFYVPTGLVSATTTKAYNDGNWHYAYVTLAASGLGIVTASLYVDGVADGSASSLLTGVTAAARYWHVGWGSAALTGGNAYFTGSLSNFTVFSTASAPAGTSLNKSSQAAFTSWASAATDHWVLADTGLVPYTGTNPVLGTTSACSATNIDWTFTSPAGTAASATALSAFVSGGPVVVPAPGPGITQVSTLALSRRTVSTPVNQYVAGLRLLVPFQAKVSATGGAWPLTFAWSGAPTVVAAP
jgi:hypothetical protein